MTREERFKIDMIDEFKDICKFVEDHGIIITHKYKMLKALEQTQPARRKEKEASK